MRPTGAWITYSKLGAEPNTLDVDLHHLLEYVERFVFDSAAVRRKGGEDLLAIVILIRVRESAKTLD